MPKTLSGQGVGDGEVGMSQKSQVIGLDWRSEIIHGGFYLPASRRHQVLYDNKFSVAVRMGTMDPLGTETQRPSAAHNKMKSENID